MSRDYWRETLIVAAERLRSGFAADMTLFATAPQREDLVVYDEWIHASVHEGLRRTRAQSVEAHATGVLGPAGRGRSAFLEGRENVVTVHTCGKALGTAGALLCGPRVLRDFIVNRGRAFVFSTAPSPLVAAVTRAALELCERSDSRREELGRRVERARHAMSRYCALTASGSHVMPVILGEDAAAVDLAARLRARGFDVRAIRPPTVPVGTARLRVALTLNVSDAAVEGLFQALGAEMAARV